MNTKKAKVLIVEDDRLLAKMYLEKFSKEGFDVICASNGEEGLNMASDQNPHIILLDMLLPKLPGDKFLQKLRENEQFKLTPVIALTNLAEKSKADDLLGESGVKEYLVKAMYTPEQVVQTVIKYLPQEGGS